MKWTVSLSATRKRFLAMERIRAMGIEPRNQGGYFFDIECAEHVAYVIGQMEGIDHVWDATRKKGAVSPKPSPKVDRAWSVAEL